MDKNKKITLTFTRYQLVTLMNAASFGCAFCCLGNDDNLEALMQLSQDVEKHIRVFGVENWNKMMQEIANKVQAKQQLWLDVNESLERDTHKPWEN